MSTSDRSRELRRRINRAEWKFVAYLAGLLAVVALFVGVFRFLFD